MGSLFSSSSAGSNSSTSSKRSDVYDNDHNNSNQPFYVAESRKRDHVLADNMKKQDTETRQFASNLITLGHMCIKYTDVYPVKINWCEQEICIKK